MTIKVSEQFNNQIRGTLNKSDQYRLNLCNSFGRLYLCPRVVYLCLGREGVSKLYEGWGIKLNLILHSNNNMKVGLAYVNYCGAMRDSITYEDSRRYKMDRPTFIPYPNLVYRKGYHENLATLSDICREEKSVEEVKERVRNWIFDTVVPLYLESLFRL